MSSGCRKKGLKGYYAFNIKDTPPHIHNLIMLAKKGQLFDMLSEEQKDLMDLLEPLNIEARYPTVKEKLMQSLSQEKCQEITKKTEALYLWIKAKLLKS
ncbi:MAG TPA: HEPN domain-containing protein [Syntrophomonas sp.]|nr:HEPN domain-containing protein [Syntrophomonas sp.]